MQASRAKAIYHDKHVTSRSVLPGALMMVRNFSGSDKRIPGIVIKKHGPVTQHVELPRARFGSDTLIN